MCIRDSWQISQIARHPLRPYTLDYISNMFSNFIEIHGDRMFGDDKAIICGLANIENESVMLIGHQKGRDSKDKVFRNFGMPKPEGYRKALRAMKLAEKFNIPILTFIDTPGAYPGIDAESRNQSIAIADNLYEMSKIKCPIISVVIGEGGSGGAIALASSNKVIMLENSIVEFSSVALSISNNLTPTSSAAAAALNQSRPLPIKSSLSSVVFTKPNVNGDTISL